MLWCLVSSHSVPHYFCVQHGKPGSRYAPAGAAEGADHRRLGLRHDADPHSAGGRLYRYYVAANLLKDRGGDCPVRRVPAGEIEAAVLDQLRGLFRAPEMVVRTWRVARALDAEICETEVRDALSQFDRLWDELFPAEQARIVHLLVERVEIGGEYLGRSRVIQDLNVAAIDTISRLY